MKIVDMHLKFRNPQARDMKRVTCIILHHSCGHGSVDSIHNMHLHNGWSGIGYHYYIRQDGTVYKGRPDNINGAHCQGNNINSIGICLEGDFRKEKPTTEQLKSMRELVGELKAKYPSIKRVFNHRDLFKTLCPVYDLKSEV